MREFCRLFNKKTIMLFFLMMILNAGLFIFEANPYKDITLTGEALDKYIDGYAGSLKQIVERGKTNSEIGLFREGYANELNRKTAKRYEALMGIELKTGDNRGIVLFLQSHISELLSLFFMLHIVTLFFEERKKGLSNMVRATARGRTHLYLYRLGIIFFTAFSSMFLLMCGNLTGVCLTFGTDDLLRPVQSLPEFRGCPYKITIFGIIMIIFVIRSVGIFLTGLLMYIVMGFAEKLLFYIIMGGIVCFEIVCSVFIAPASSWYILKVVNIYTLIKSEDYLKGCVYLNLFGNAVDGVLLTFVFCVCLVLILTALGFKVFGKKYDGTAAVFSKCKKTAEAIREKISTGHSLFGWECYKLFIKQGALIIILICIMVRIRQSSRYGYYYALNAEEKLMYMNYSGGITPEKLAQAENWMAALKKSETAYEQKLDDIMNTVPFDARKYEETKEILGKNKNLQKNFEPVLNDLKSAYSYTEKTGKSVSLIEPYSYDFLINRDKQTRQRASFLAIAAIIAAVAGIYVSERNTNMKQLINTTYKGRSTERIIKPVLIIAVSFTCAVAFSLVQMININNSIPFTDMDKPVQGLRYLNDFPIYMSLRTYLILILFIRGLFGILIGFITAFFSYYGKDKFEVLCKVTIMMVIWILVTEFIPHIETINPIKLLGYV